MAGSATTLSSKLGSILSGSGLSESQQGMLDSLNQRSANLIPTPPVDITDPASIEAEMMRLQKAGDIQGAMAMQQQLRGVQAEQRAAAERSAQLNQPIRANGASERRDMEARRALSQKLIDAGHPDLAGPARDGSLTELEAMKAIRTRSRQDAETGRAERREQRAIAKDNKPSAAKVAETKWRDDTLAELEVLKESAGGGILSQAIRTTLPNYKGGTDSMTNVQLGMVRDVAEEIFRKKRNPDAPDESSFWTASKVRQGGKEEKKAYEDIVEPELNDIVQKSGYFNDTELEAFKSDIKAIGSHAVSAIAVREGLNASEAATRLRDIFKSIPDDGSVTPANISSYIKSAIEGGRGRPQSTPSAINKADVKSTGTYRGERVFLMKDGTKRDSAGNIVEGI